MSTKIALIVEDSPTVLKLEQMALEGAGWQVFTAEDGEEALKIINNGQKIDLIVTDLNMPNIGGMELIQIVRRKPELQNVPILVVTTEGDTGTKNRGKESGANGWITKPFKPESFVEAVNTLYERAAENA